ncbi:2-succinyl-5-enolpyruvyl-6-hydroxy-3-cyclohexene-1-carboxylic-acid synthase [Ornithinibacillus halophilus]|uniref:2-succinyl-5-enolpyruvyl-6-hydroxy-3-cyclohexene-1-carboxylate synthase n=1 Tax=Ornithinibacillus halophilus TaxID=930117 RepID=A0A1M5K6T2_9BACI|nr:2-succinyl-5-enolpyruvyl-6-hydroxy-3-cyclohexene-1-carboxylic-acid synthase [Ornithinibacillus halophilus]SHG48454.1 2-succinyl-5-enolpyruvyl-6-hydroxy-3-cyclohexene-1-carboxylate synthase [Ornithinibacillus halophilus]
MNYREDLTRYVSNFVDELAVSGLTDVVISPGSRSTPLAMTFSEHEKIKEWVILDERSAAFFGLGLAKQTNRPVAILCSSGTAAANYFPAIVEAFHSRVPLIVLTADRPHELRDVGAPQAIDQIKLYGDYVKWFHEMALPESTETMLNYVRSKAARAINVAMEGNSGPVHLNFPFREPLVPDFSLENLWGNQTSTNYFQIDGYKKIPDSNVKQLVQLLQSKQKGLIVCGPQIDPDLGEAVTLLAKQWGIPVLSDPLSQVRSGEHNKDNIIEGYDAFLRHEDIRHYLQYDYLIRFGAMPVSKAYLFYVQENQQALHFVVEENSGYREPTNHQTEFIFADSIQLCSDLLEANVTVETDPNWLEDWCHMNHITKKILSNTQKEQSLTEGEAVRTLLNVLPHESSLYVGNSMAVRDVDTFFMGTERKINVLANRGANGIDGMISSGVGAAVSGKPVTLLLGDLSFYHDMNGLLAAKHYNIDLTILLINNNGGGIFSFLPQAKEEKHFESLFGTPVDIDFKHAVNMYGGSYHSASKEEELHNVLKESYQEKGLSVIEVKTDRSENVTWHRDLWTQIQEEIINTVMK